MSVNQVLKKSFFWLAMGGFFCLSSVAIGAFAAHGLQNVLKAPDIQLIETAARYQMYHGFAIIMVALIQMSVNKGSIKEATNKKDVSNINVLSCNRFFVLVILVFSGSLYALSIQRGLFAGVELPSLVYLVTPLGGMFLIFAWCLLFIKCVKSRNSFV